METTAEDSVVVSIHELKRISTARSTRERAARQDAVRPSEDTRKTPAPRRTFERLPGTAPLAAARPSDRMSAPAPIALPAPGVVRNSGATVSLAQMEAAAMAEASLPVPAAQAPPAPLPDLPPRQAAWMPAVSAPAAEPFAGMMQRQKPRSAAGPVLLVTLALGAAGGVGYFKLQEQTLAALATKDAALIATEEQSRRAEEAAASAQRQVKALEARVQALSAAAAAGAKGEAPVTTGNDGEPAAAPPAEAASPLAAPPAAKVVARPAPAAARKAVKRTERPRARAARRDSGSAASPSAGAAAREDQARSGVPNIARRKRLSDDPLAGIGL